MAMHKPKYIFIPVDTLIHVEHTHIHTQTYIYLEEEFTCTCDFIQYYMSKKRFSFPSSSKD